MNGSTRIWGIAGGAAAVVVLAGGFLLGVQPALATADSIDQATAAAMVQNQATQVKLVGLSKAAAKLDAMKAENATLLKAAPSILKPNRVVRRINELAALNGVALVSMSINDAVAYTPPLSGSSAIGTLPLAKTSALITAANFTAVPTTVVVSGPEGAVFRFAHDLQNDERMFAISNVQTSLDDTGTVTGTFSGYIYTLKR